MKSAVDDGYDTNVRRADVSYMSGEKKRVMCLWDNADRPKVIVFLD